MPPTHNFFQLAYQTKEFARQQLPIIERQVSDLIKREEKDREIIKCLLKIISTLVEMGAGKAQYERLNEYYMRVIQNGKR
jgi:hypothetical protein